MATDPERHFYTELECNREDSEAEGSHQTTCHRKQSEIVGLQYHEQHTTAHDSTQQTVNALDGGTLAFHVRAPNQFGEGRAYISQATCKAG